jgi:hypothetical protein
VTGPADTAGPGFAYPLPLTADGVSAAWLSAALRPRYPRAHERDLLGGYLKTLASFGVPVPGSGEAWEQYRRATVYGFLCWLCNPDIWQPPDVNAATFARFGMAMLDHDTYAALGV